MFLWETAVGIKSKSDTGTNFKHRVCVASSLGFLQCGMIINITNLSLFKATVDFSKFRIKLNVCTSVEYRKM
jgi:regulation of enolase protein 1 (concanavalin A-like superfamily)